MKNGYFLIEISICLTLILIISALALPNLNFLTQQIVSSDLEKINMTFSYLQQSSITGNKKIELKFNQPKTYSYENIKEELSNNVEFNIIDGIKGPPSMPTKQISSPVTFLNNQVMFYPDGKIQPGTAYLVDKSKKYLYALTVPVSQVSFIRKYKNQNNKWILI